MFGMVLVSESTKYNRTIEPGIFLSTFNLGRFYS